MPLLHINDTISGPGYDIRISDSFKELPSLISDSGLSGGKALIVTDSRVAPIYLEEVKETVSSGFSLVESIVIPEGEENKNLDTVREILLKLLPLSFDRRDLIIALGGGVIGDMSGFASAVYLRGIRFLQIPTTLLSQTDSSIGGKTGVDIEGYKNMAGAFHQPAAVYINVSVLDTLPERIYSSGMGEIIKHGLIRDSSYFDRLIRDSDLIMKRDRDTLSGIIYASLKIKAAVVEEDPTEKGLRAILNFGHTLGHAIEKYHDFKLLHGECVGLGMIASSFISLKRGGISEAEYEAIRSAVSAFSLPTVIPGEADIKEILKISKSDKKMDRGKIKFILLKKMGEAVIDTTVTEEEMLEGLSILKDPSSLRSSG